MRKDRKHYTAEEKSGHLEAASFGQGAGVGFV